MRPIFIYYLVPPRQPIPDERLDAAAKFIAARYPTYRVVRKIDRCRPRPLRRRRAFSSMVKQLKWCTGIVLPSRLALFGTTREELDSLFADWRERRVWMDVLWDDGTYVSTHHENTRNWLLGNLAKIEDWCREELARCVEERNTNSRTPRRSRVDPRDAVLTAWLFHMKDRFRVPYDRLYAALWTSGIHRPNGSEYSRGAIQRRVETARAQRRDGNQIASESEVPESPEAAALRLRLREIEKSKGCNRPPATRRKCLLKPGMGKKPPWEITSGRVNDVPVSHPKEAVSWSRVKDRKSSSRMLWRTSSNCGIG